MRTPTPPPREESPHLAPHTLRHAPPRSRTPASTLSAPAAQSQYVSNAYAMHPYIILERHGEWTRLSGVKSEEEPRGTRRLGSSDTGEHRLGRLQPPLL